MGAVLVMTKATPRPRPARILVVEDSESLRKLLICVLKARGYEILHAPSAEEALELARTTPFELLVTDILLRGMDGPDLAGRLREVRPGLKVLFMSGWGEERLSERGVDVDAEAFLGKPFTADELARAIERLLTKS